MSCWAAERAASLLAWHLGGLGRRVAVVERRWIGGSCPNINCLPSKNEIWSAKVADLLHHAAQFGIVTGSVAIDMAKVRDASARWSMGWSLCTWNCTRRAAPS